MSKDTSRYYSLVQNDNETLLYNLDGTLVSIREAQQIATELIKTFEQEVYIYIGKSLNENYGSNLIKIGMSSNPYKRAKRLKLELIHLIPCKRYDSPSPRSIEQSLHRVFTAQKQQRGGEWFAVEEHQIEELKKLRSAWDVEKFEKFSTIILEFKREVESIPPYSDQYFRFLFNALWDGAYRYEAIRYIEKACLYLASIGERTLARTIWNEVKHFFNRKAYGDREFIKLSQKELNI